MFFIFVFLATSTQLMCGMKEFETRHCRVIYDESMEEHVIPLYLRADEIAEREFEFFNYRPNFKIKVVLVDGHTDNAYALPPLGTIFIYPHISSGEGKNYRHVVEQTFIHELSHILLGLKLHGSFRINLPTRNFCPPNIFIPQWFNEGIAVYLESTLSEGGRLKSPYFNSKIRLDSYFGLTLAGNFRMASFDGYAYTQGSSFIRYYVESSGEEALKKVFELMSKDYFPRPLKHMARLAHTSEERLIDNWRRTIELRSPYHKIVCGRRLDLPLGYKCKLTKDGKHLYFVQDMGDGSYIYRYSKDDGFEKLASFEGGEFSVYNSKIYSSRRYETFSGDMNPFYVPISTAVYENNVLLPYEDAVRVFNTPFGIFYVERKSGYEILKDSEGFVIFKGDYCGKITHGEKSIFFDGIKTGEMGIHIYEYSLANRELKKWVEGSMPCVDGQYIYFSGSTKNTENIFRLNMNGGKPEQLTNVLYSAYSPFVLDGILYYINIDMYGPEIYYMEDIKPVSSCADGLDKSVLVVEEKLANDLSIPSKQFSRGLNFFISPYLTYCEQLNVGVAGSMSEDLLRHYLLTGIDYNYGSGTGSFLISYIYWKRFFMEVNCHKNKVFISCLEGLCSPGYGWALGLANDYFDGNIHLACFGTIPIFVKRLQAEISIRPGFLLELDIPEEGLAFCDLTFEKSNYPSIEIGFITPLRLKKESLKLFDKLLNFNISWKGFEFSMHEKVADGGILDSAINKSFSLRHTRENAIDIGYGTIDSFFAFDNIQISNGFNAEFSGKQDLELRYSLDITSNMFILYLCPFVVSFGGVAKLYGEDNIFTGPLYSRAVDVYLSFKVPLEI